MQTLNQDLDLAKKGIGVPLKMRLNNR